MTPHADARTVHAARAHGQSPDCTADQNGASHARSRALPMRPARNDLPTDSHPTAPPPHHRTELAMNTNKHTTERRWFNGREFCRATWHDGGPGGTVILVHVIAERKSPAVF